MPPYKKPRILRKKNIKRRTGGRAQSRQISALSTQVTKLTKINFSRIRTVWQKGNQTINMPVAEAGIIPYICPIPYAPCITTHGSADKIKAAKWQDNNLSQNRVIDQDGYGKRFVFGVPEAALNANLGYHTGGTLKYQMILQGDFATATVAKFQKVGLYLIRPKKALADQLVREKLLIKRRPITAPPLLEYPGGDAFLDRDKDYVIHDGLSSDSDMTTYFGSMINSKYWTVVHKREVTFSHPAASNSSNNVNANNASPANNALTASGTIQLPAGGILKNVSPVLDASPGDVPTQAVLDMNLEDQRNENSVFLVAISNIPKNEAQVRNGLSLGFIVEDRYKIVV